jgi:hypothetical protein
LQREADLNAKGYSERDETRILDALGRGLLKEFPNPERAGCPGSDVLKRIASHEMPLPEAEKWLDHVTSCSPCYSDFSQYQAAHQRRRRRTLLALAASILIAIGIAGWVLLQKDNESLVAQTAVLDLRNRSIPRGTEPNPGEPPLEINHVAMYWNIYLPLGSSEGEYDIRIVTPSGELLFAAGGTAKLTDHITSLQIPASLSSSRSGSYVLQIRKTGSGWTSYPLQLR